MKRERVHHYTKGFHLTSIIENGINVTDLLCGNGERSAAWFTFAAEYEPTALPCNVGDDMAANMPLPEADMVARGLVRITVPESVAPVTWTKWAKQSGVTRAMAQALERSAIVVGARPRQDWRCTFRHVPRTEWLSIDIWSDGRWLPMWSRETGLDMAVAKP